VINVISVMKKPLSLRARVRTILKQKKWQPKQRGQGKTYFDDSDPSWVILNHAGPVTDHDIPDADVVIATWWETAEWINSLSPEKGVKVYFCQGFETHIIRHRKRVEATYSLAIKKICVSNWVGHKIYSLTGVDDHEVVKNGVDLKQFYPAKYISRDSLCFGFVFSEERIKGIDIIVRALILAKIKNPNIKAVAFGSSLPSVSKSLPPWVKFYEAPSQDSIHEIYSKCAAWLFASRAEGFGLPVLEAMACKTPVIATPAGAAPELVSDTCGFLIPHENPTIMSEKILAISRMEKSTWQLMSESSYQVALKNDWNKAAMRFENIIEASIK
jgi:glycosyltransferase involved in cell wall biosynthesis